METTPPIQQVPMNTPQHIRPKIGRNVLSFWGIILVVLLIVLCLLSILVAKAGLVRLPLFSRLYTGPQPTRTVDAPKGTVAEFRELLGKRLFLAQLAAQNSDVLRVSVSEAELTTALRDSIREAFPAQDVSVERVQIAVLADQIELLALVRRSGVRADLLIRFRPKIEGSSLTFEPSYFQLGDFSLPVSLAEKFAALIFSRDLGKWDIRSEQFRVDRVELDEETIEIVVQRTSR